ncbi:MAG: DUF692 family protein [Anaerolineae bacterium]|nr:DUF692 family protein [Anaerolineae bacterium]
MRFAINWSPEAADLLRTGQIEIDLYKCPDWPEVVTPAREQRPSYVHFPLSIGKGQARDWDFAQIENWLDTTETTFVNCHINPTQEIFPKDIALDDLLEPLTQEVQTLVDQFGAERVIIENSPISELNIERGYLRQGVEARIFQEISATTNCGFLLDVSHARLTCETTGDDPHQYMQSLPVSRLRELHITGIGIWNLGIRGDHMPLTDSDWHMTEWVVQQIRERAWNEPYLMAFEYGGIGKLKDWCGSDGDKIAEQVPRLFALAHSTDASIAK